MSSCYGLIGYPLSHSFSAAYFQKKFEDNNIDAVFMNFSINSLDKYHDILNNNPDLKGLSVTIPYKKEIISYLDEIDADAAKIGAVNCISVKNGVTKGYNTDVIGFEKSIVPLLKPWHNKALILGTGGASNAVALVLDKLNIGYMFVSRKVEDIYRNIINYEMLQDSAISKYNLIINTTPLGMFPHNSTFPKIHYYNINSKYLLYDLVYNPEETMFLKFGKANGAAIKNGYEMLQLQADASWEIWNRA